jgi:Cytochrome P450
VLLLLILAFCFAQLIGNVKQFFLAGTDTVGGVMSWLMYELATNQAVQDKLRAEILSVITQGDTPFIYICAHMLCCALCMHTHHCSIDTRTV